MRYCFRIGLYKQGLLHDLSKYEPVEFLVGCKYYQGDRSPNNAEREATGISRSWLHHKGRNKHHFEYWVDYVPGDEHIINGVPMRWNPMSVQRIMSFLLLLQRKQLKSVEYSCCVPIWMAVTCMPVKKCM